MPTIEQRGSGETGHDYNVLNIPPQFVPTAGKI